MPFVLLLGGLFGFFLWRQSQPSSPKMLTLPVGSWVPASATAVMSQPGVYRFEMVLPQGSAPLSQADFMTALATIREDLADAATVDFLSISYPGNVFVSSSGTVAPNDWPAPIDMTPWIQRWQVTATHPLSSLDEDLFGQDLRAAWMQTTTPTVATA